MPLLRRRRQSDETVTAWPIDPAMGDPDAGRLITAMAGADWPAAREILAAATDDQDLSFYTQVAAAVPGSEEWLPGIVRANLDDTLPLLVYGARGIEWAWEARTGRRARYVDRDQFEVFFERLRVAEDALQGVVRREPDNVTAWTNLLTTARGLQLGVDEARRRFDEVDSRYPGHLNAHRTMLQMLCAKWAGSHQQMHDFARESMAKAAPGSQIGSLVAAAHLENWLHLGRSEERAAYFARPSVRASINEAADQSVRHPDYRLWPGWPVTHNQFAAAFSLARDYPSAADQFRVIGTLVTRGPWQYFSNNPGYSFAERRHRAYTNT